MMKLAYYIFHEWFSAVMQLLSWSSHWFLMAPYVLLYDDIHTRHFYVTPQNACKEEETSVGGYCSMQKYHGFDAPTACFTQGFPFSSFLLFVVVLEVKNAWWLGLVKIYIALFIVCKSCHVSQKVPFWKQLPRETRLLHNVQPLWHFYVLEMWTNVPVSHFLVRCGRFARFFFFFLVQQKI